MATFGLSETTRTGRQAEETPLIPGFRVPLAHKHTQKQKKNQKKKKEGAVRLSSSLARWLYAAPSSQGRVCAEIGSVISQRRRLLHSTVGSQAGMMMVLGISHGRKVPLSTLMSRACHWAARDTAIRPLCHGGTIG